MAHRQRLGRECAARTNARHHRKAGGGPSKLMPPNINRAFATQRVLPLFDLSDQAAIADAVFAAISAAAP